MQGKKEFLQFEKNKKEEGINLGTIVICLQMCHCSKHIERKEGENKIKSLESEEDGDCNFYQQFYQQF